MCRKLGKKHFQYVGNDGVERQKRERMMRAPWRRLCDSYRVRILNDHCFLRDRYWNPQHNKGLSRLTPAKERHYAKLERYYFATN